MIFPSSYFLTFGKSKIGMPSTDEKKKKVFIVFSLEAIGLCFKR